jgi:hypothetical protein
MTLTPYWYGGEERIQKWLIVFRPSDSEKVKLDTFSTAPSTWPTRNGSAESRSRNANYEIKGARQAPYAVANLSYPINMDWPVQDIVVVSVFLAFARAH